MMKERNIYSSETVFKEFIPLVSKGKEIKGYQRICTVFLEGLYGDTSITLNTSFFGFVT